MLSCANASDGRTTVASASRALSRARDDIARSLAQAGADCNRLRPVRAEIPSARRRFLLEATPTEGTGAMERAMTGRRAALDGLARILDAGAPEELFTGPEDEAHFLYGLLVDTARARASARGPPAARGDGGGGPRRAFGGRGAATPGRAGVRGADAGVHRGAGRRGRAARARRGPARTRGRGRPRALARRAGERDRRARARARSAPYAGEPQARPRGIGAASARGGGSSAGVSWRASAASQGAVAASRAATSSAGSVIAGTLARRLRPSTRRLRAPRRFPCIR